MTTPARRRKPADARCDIRCRASEKARWIKAAHQDDRDLSQWIVNRLNVAAEKELEK